MIERTTVWLISVRAGSQRRDLEFRTRGEETPKDTYRRVKRNAEIIALQLPEQAIVEIISKTVAFKPKGRPPHKNWYWCPFCNKWRVFSYNDYLGTNQCSICGVSDREFYVKTYNNLWGEELIQGRKIKK